MHQISYAHRTRTASAAPVDSRWVALGAVQAAMDSLGLKARDIAVLRGLLSFVPADRWSEALIVFASNAALQARCDGIDERTLRRRLTRLCDVGLILRKQSPNRKRYVVRDETGATVLSYGFDLSPLRDNLERLQTLAAESRAEAARVKLLKAVLRDRLYHLHHAGFPPETLAMNPDNLHRMLRQKTDSASLEAAISMVEGLLGPVEKPSENKDAAMIMSDTDGHNDRHIQSSDKEHFDDYVPAHGQAHKKPAKADDLTLTDCLEAANSAIEFCQERPRSWADLSTLAHQLAPAIGVDAQQLNRTKTALGERGTALAVLGLVQAFGRIRDPNRYLNALASQASNAGLDITRMFRSLTGTSRFPAGNHRHALC